MSPERMMRDLAPVLVVDSREQAPLPFSRLATRPGTLLAGDYSIAGAETLFSCERKTVPDFVTCCTSERERFERELVRLRGYRFKRLVIIGSETDIVHGNFRSLANPKAVLATLYCFEIRYDLPVVFCATPEIAGRQIERWAIWFAREVCKNASLLREGSEVENAEPQKTRRLNDEKPESSDIRTG
jgi:ERCC4-type nuclease